MTADGGVNLTKPRLWRKANLTWLESSMDPDTTHARCTLTAVIEGELLEYT